MSRLSIFAAAVVLSALTATSPAFAKEHHHIRNAPQYAIARWSYAALQPPIHYGATPSYNDPSKFGGSTALSVTH